MRQRPIGDLLDALRQLGADAVSELDNGCPPVVVRGQRPAAAAGRRLAGDVSSQFLSGLLMAAPYADGRVELVVAGELVSKPYIDMTLAVMAAFGVSMLRGRRRALTGRSPVRRFLRPQRYRGRHYAIEPDASAASYFFAAAAITGGEMTVEGLSRDSLQGDVAFCDCLRQMGCRVRYAADRSRWPAGRLRESTWT